MEVSGCLGKKRLTTGTVGFGLAPRINAAGRLERRDEGRRDAHDRRHRPSPASSPRSSTAATRERQEVEQTIVAEAHEMIDDAGRPGRPRGDRRSASAGWHPGVIGIVASRLAETYHRPAIVVALGDADRPGLGPVGRRASTSTRRSQACSDGPDRASAATPPPPA